MPAVTDSPLRRWLPVVVVALAGASLGGGAAHVSDRVLLEQGPEGWHRTVPRIPVLLAQLAGPPNQPGDGWPLASHGALSAPGDRVQALEVAATLPDTGHLEVVLEGSGAQQGVALQVDRGGQPYAVVTTAASISTDASQPMEDRTPLSCTGALPAPTTERVVARLEREGGGVEASLTVGEAAPVVVRCTWGRPTTGASVRSGLRRVGLRSLAVSPQGGPRHSISAPPSRPGRVALASLLGFLVAAALAASARLHPRLRVRGGPMVLVAAPLVGVAALATADLSAALQAVRIVVDAPLWAAVGVPAALSALLALLLALQRASAGLSRLSRGARLGWAAVLGLAAVPAYGLLGLLAVPLAMGFGEGVTWLAGRLGARGAGPVPPLVIGGVGLGVLAALAGPRHGMATTYAAGAGMALGGLIWANVRRPRGFNLISLVLMGTVVGVADLGLRWTDTGARLTGRSSRARPGGADDDREAVSGTFSSFEALEHTRAWSDYPYQDYPVEPPPRRGDAVRVVAMGGSSTGGAWQNDDLSQFWPAELERRHGPSIQAVNLGVGGWTTLHVRRFLETRVDDADPDVVVLYIGHNDVVTESVRPYGQLFEAWRHGSDATVAFSGAMSAVPLYQLARFGLQGAFGSAQGAAVPVGDARENLQTIQGLLAPRGVPLLLAREGVGPDPSVLDAYGAMLAELARASTQVGFVDTSAALTGPGAGDVFLDNCHLTERGHARVAEAVRQALLDAGWIPGTR